MQNIELSDVDLQIINALQIEPRISWTALAGVISLDSVTLARRWERIIASGHAWPIAWEQSRAMSSTAIIEVQCNPGEALLTAQQASRDPAIISIDLTSGSRDILMTLIAKDDHELAEYVTTRLGTLPGVRSIRTYVLNSILKLGSNWTVRALTPIQASRIPRFRPPRAGAAKVVPAPLAARIISLLEHDVRITNAELAKELGISAQRASDSVATLRTQGILDLRVNVAEPYSNWPVVTWYFLQVPSASLLEAEESWLSMPEMQFAGVSFGKYNLIVALAARSRADTLRLEHELESKLPGARVADRSAVVRVHKHVGHILDASGRATGEIISMQRP